MTVDRLRTINKIDIWQPRWKDRKVLLATFKVKQDNIVVFTKTPSLKGEFYISGATARQYPLENNGKIDCYAVPLSELEPVERV
jgi:hypothetical protein